MGEVGLVELSLSELARRSRVSKPNIYRYFESREEILLQVWVEEVRDLTERLETTFAGVSVGDMAGTAKAITSAFRGQPRLCELTSIISTVIERNLSAAAIAAAKQVLIGLTLRTAQLLHGRLPAIPIGDCVWAVSAIGAFVAGIWPAAHPVPAVAEVLSRPEFAGMKPDFDRDLLRFIEVLLSGLLSAGAAAKAANERIPVE